MNEQMKIWGGFGRVVTLCAGLGLAGCASNEASVPQVEIEKPVTIEIVPQYDIDPAKAIDTSHLPKKTIKTPWGPREIPDQSKNPELREALETMQRLGKSSYSLPEYRKAANLATRIHNIQNNDILRLGCAELRDSTCSFNFYIYANDCGPKHNFGSNILSKCEQSSIKKIQRPMVGYTSCKLEGRIIRPLTMFSNNSVNDQVDLMLAHECKIWRGEKNWDKIYLATQPVNVTKPKE